MRAEVVVYSLKTTQSRNVTQQINIYQSDTVPNDITTTSEECVRLAKVDVWISMLSIILYLQM